MPSGGLEELAKPGDLALARAKLDDLKLVEACSTTKSTRWTGDFDERGAVYYSGAPIKSPVCTDH